MSKNPAVVNPNERLEDLHRNGLYLIQNPERFCFGVDAVLLTGFAKVKPNETVMDLCTGTGVIPILLSAKTRGSHFTGIEIQEEDAALARRSVAYNGLESKIDIVCGDIRNMKELFAPSTFHVVTVNPPYMNVGGGLINEAYCKAVARHEISCTFADVCAAAKWLLTVGGRMYTVHHPHRLADIIYELREHRLEPKALRFVQAKQTAAPMLVLIEAVYGAKPFMNVLPPLIIYGDNGNYTKEIHEIYYGE